MHDITENTFAAFVSKLRWSCDFIHLLCILLKRKAFNLEVETFLRVQNVSIKSCLEPEVSHVNISSSSHDVLYSLGDHGLPLLSV